MSPTRPPTFHELYRGGRKATDAAYNRSRAHDPTEKALHGRRWQECRRLALARDGHLCVECRAKGIYVKAKDVDHIIPRSVAPERMWDVDNLRSLCRSCHNAKTHADRTGEVR